MTVAVNDITLKLEIASKDYAELVKEIKRKCALELDQARNNYMAEVSIIST